ncbi:hypothetical protein VME_05090 [Vibrio harveyi 1DA3]|nr:hypothetical protein VME_05090 [Vibrio harveyi 1DA3]
MKPHQIVEETKKIFQQLLEEIQIKSEEDNSFTWHLEADHLIDYILSYDTENDDLDIEKKISIYKKCYVKHRVEDKSKKNPELANLVWQSYIKECKISKRTGDRYKIITTISYDNTNKLKLRSRVIDGCHISFHKQLTEKANKNRNYIFNEFKSQKEAKDISSYTYAVISLVAPNENTAITKALNALSLYRAILNVCLKKQINILHLNTHQMYPCSSAVSTGKYHTLHKGTYKPTYNKSLWFEHGQADKGAMRTRSNNLDDLISKSLTKYRKSPIKEHLRKSLVTYIEALDSENSEYRFIKLWSALEVLLQSDNTKSLCKMISSFFEDVSLIREKINSSRASRNRAVHISVSNANLNGKTFDLINFFELIFNFHLNNPFKFQKLNEFNHFTNSPRDVKHIDRQIETLKIAKKYCSN